MTQRRHDEVWYTVLYREPHTLWWAPAVFVAFALLLFNRFVLDRSWAESLAVAAVIGVPAGVGVYVRHRHRQRT